jgi:hypothetical protein
MFFAFSDPVILFQMICTVPITLVTVGLVLFERDRAPAFTNLAVSVSFGMWMLLCLLESNHSQPVWAWMTGFYLFGAAMFYFALRALESFIHKFD